MPIENIINLDSAYSVTIGVIFLFIGMSLTRRLKLLQNLTIPEPVTGGLIAAIIIAIIYYSSVIQLTLTSH
ncbi:MAG: ESS family glutamate:Na+ symporter [Francisellaceae bacterium]|jgi:ESS family glutamate:Na+ symporter